MIVVSNISKSYKKKNVLGNISFEAQSGELVVIVGRNGCGKSTLLQIMAGVLKPDGGEISYYGENVVGKLNLFRKYCGYVPQENPLMEELTVRDNLRLWGSSKKVNMSDIIHQFQLEDILKVRVEKLSGGMKRRLSIACALMEWPPILLLDEPTTALDIYYKKSMMEWLGEYRNLNGTVVMTTHEEQEILKADRCLVMADGCVRPLTKDQICMGEIHRHIDPKYILS